MQHKCYNCELMDGALYKTGVSTPLLLCISKLEGKSLLDEIHSGECGSHASVKALVGKAFR